MPNVCNIYFVNVSVLSNKQGLVAAIYQRISRDRSYPYVKQRNELHRLVEAKVAIVWPKTISRSP